MTVPCSIYMICLNWKTKNDCRSSLKSCRMAEEDHLWNPSLSLASWRSNTPYSIFRVPFIRPRNMDASNWSQASVRLAAISLAFLGGWVGDPGTSRMLSKICTEKVPRRDSLAAGDTNRQPVQLTGGGGAFSDRAGRQKVHGTGW